MQAKQKTIVESIICLRLLVLSLGEQHRWWQSSFLNTTGLKFLEHIFPKTKYLASLNAASAVAQEAHDKFIGIGKYHLFRLPERLEEKIFQVLSQDDFSAQIIQEIEGKEMERLESLTEYVAISEQEGPVMIGGENDLQEEKIFSVFAKHYYDAFKNSYQTYPYLK